MRVDAEAARRDLALAVSCVEDRAGEHRNVVAHARAAPASAARSRSAGSRGPGGNLPASTQSARFWWVALMMRTSTGSSSVEPTLRTFFSWIARSSFTCIGSGRSATSSRNSVPPLAAWKKPSRSRVGAGERALCDSRRTRSPSGSPGSRRSSPARTGRRGATLLQVDQARREFLAAARFAGDVDRRLAARELLDQRADAADRGDSPSRRASRRAGAFAVAFWARSAAGSFSAELHQRAQLVELNRLGE